MAAILKRHFHARAVTDASDEFFNKAARKIIREGVKFKFTYQKNGKLIIKNNFPGLNQSNIVHVRPHAAKSAYRINGEVYGDLKNANELPNGDMLTNSCFFINNYYILKQIQD